MQFNGKIKSRPYKIKNVRIPDVFEMLPDGNVKVTETLRREVYLTKEEAVNAQKAIEEKIRFHETEISEQYLDIVKNDIKTLKAHNERYKKMLKDLK